MLKLLRKVFIYRRLVEEMHKTAIIIALLI